MCGYRHGRNQMTGLIRLAAALAIVVAAAVPASAQAPVPAGHVKTVSGAATIVRGGATLPATAGAPVYATDTLRTGAGPGGDRAPAGSGDPGDRTDPRVERVRLDRSVDAAGRAPHDGRRAARPDDDPQRRRRGAPVRRRARRAAAAAEALHAAVQVR